MGEGISIRLALDIYGEGWGGSSSCCTMHIVLYNGPPGDTYCLVHCWKTTYSLSVPFPEFLWRKRNLLTSILPLPPISAFLHHPRWRIDWSFDCWLIGGRLLVSTNAVHYLPASGIIGISPVTTEPSAGLCHGNAWWLCGCSLHICGCQN